MAVSHRQGPGADMIRALVTTRRTIAVVDAASEGSGPGRATDCDPLVMSAAATSNEQDVGVESFPKASKLCRSIHSRCPG